VESVEEEVSNTLRLLARLDFIFAKGAFSLAIRGTCPKLVEDSQIRIVNGRHPLIDPSTVVPISLELGKDYHTLVITGPNTGGKTVTLKTIGLFVLMAQSGLHLPADFGSKLGIFNNVFADIGDEQSIEQSLSTFSSHMTNIVKFLNNVQPGDLVLFDELGAGTDPTEGAALAMSILDHLHRKGVCTLATTHYSELKVYAITQKGVENASVEFDVETLRPTYRLMTGIPGKSNAFEISRRLGLAEELIEGAKEYLSKEDIRFEDIMGSIEKNRIAAERERMEAQKALAEIEELKAKLREQEERLRSQRTALLSKSKEEARKILKDAKAEADRIIEELRQLARETETKERNRAIEDARRKLKQSLSGLEEGIGEVNRTAHTLTKPPKNLKLGETVYIVSLAQKGQVLSTPDTNGDVMVQVGIMKVNVNLVDLRRTGDDDSTQVDKKSNRKISLRTLSVLTELDLRGQDSEEALINTDRYLDDAFLAGLKEVTIIHGKGTGILRNAIHQQLRRHPHVESFRLGKYGEGETGVTVVILK
jgi:DNA mismatch repair protein MutS2